MRQRPLQRILLVDDDEDIRRVGALALERVGGFDVEICASGAEALQKAPVFEPDLVLLDVMMPEMDGIAVFEALSEHSDISDIPVVFITAKAQKPEIARYLVVGAIGVIKKPFDPMTLADEIRRIWDKKKDGEDDEIEEMRELVEGYVHRLDQRLDKIDELLHRARGSQTVESLRRMRDIAHLLAGSGQMFGLPAVTEICRQFEELADDLLDQDRSIGSDDLEQLQSLCRRLRGIIAKESRRRPGA